MLSMKSPMLVYVIEIPFSELVGLPIPLPSSNGVPLTDALKKDVTLVRTFCAHSCFVLKYNLVPG